MCLLLKFRHSFDKTVIVLILESEYNIIQSVFESINQLN